MAAAPAFYATVYDASTVEGKVVAIDANGNVTDYATGFEQPEGIVRDSRGDLFVIDGADLWRISAPGVRTLVGSKPNPFNSWGMAIDASDNIYTWGSNSITFMPELYQFTAASGYASYETWAAPGGGTGLTIGPDGALYTAGNGISRYDTTTGNYTAYYTFSGDFDGFQPFDLSFNAQGELFVSGFLEGDQVVKISADLQAIEAVVISGLSDVRGITLDAHGALFMANWTCGCPDEPNAIMSQYGTGTAVFADLGVFSPNYLIAVPEPSSLALLAIGGLGWLGLRMRPCRRSHSGNQIS